MKITIPLLLLLPLSLSAQEVHPEVQAALDWELQEHDCVLPKVRPSHDSTTGSERAYERAKNKFEKCYDDYKKDLVAQRQVMMGVANHGLTLQQAETIMDHMETIQVFVISEYNQPVTWKNEIRPEEIEVEEHFH